MKHPTNILCYVWLRVEIKWMEIGNEMKWNRSDFIFGTIIIQNKHLKMFWLLCVCVCVLLLLVLNYTVARCIWYQPASRHQVENKYYNLQMNHTKWTFAFVHWCWTQHAKNKNINFISPNFGLIFFFFFVRFHFASSFHSCNFSFGYLKTCFLISYIRCKYNNNTWLSVSVVLHWKPLNPKRKYVCWPEFRSAFGRNCIYVLCGWRFNFTYIVLRLRSEWVGSKNSYRMKMVSCVQFTQKKKDFYLRECNFSIRCSVVDFVCIQRTHSICSPFIFNPFLSIWFWFADFFFLDFSQTAVP